MGVRKILTSFFKKKNGSVNEDQYYKDLFLNNEYWNKKDPNEEEAKRWNIMKDFLEQLNVNSNSNEILDLGCGRGWLSNLMSHYGNVTSIEPVKAVAQYAKKLFPHLNISSGNSTDLLRKGKALSFDIIVASEVIEHVEDKASFIKDIHMLLKPSGYLIITTPRKEAEQEWNKYTLPGQPLEDWMYERDLENLLTELYFKTISIKRFSIKPSEIGPEIEIYQLWLFQKNI